MDLAHGVGGGADLPIPVGSAALGGALALAISFAVVSVAWRRPRYETAHPGRALPGLTRLVDASATRQGLRVLGMTLLGFVVFALAFGPAEPSVNPAPDLVLVVFWVGLVPASIMFGPVLRALNPARTIYIGIRRLAHARADADADPARGPETRDPETRGREIGGRDVPEWVGWWPAAAGLLAFAWLELVYPDPATRLAVGLALGLWAVVVIGGALFFGEGWIERADPFETWSTLASHLSPWRRREDGQLGLTSPLRHLAEVPNRPGLVAVVAVLLGSTAFDSFAGSTRWLRFTQSTNLNVVLVETAVLVAGMGAIAVVFVLTTALPARWSGVSGRGVPTRLAPSLLPIAIGYVAAHYLTLLVETGQAAVIQSSDPLGRGWNLFGTAERQVDLWLSLHPTLLASTKVGAIVLGHLVGAIAAHDRSLALLPVKHRVSAQLPLLLTMVGFTAGGLTLLLGG